MVQIHSLFQFRGCNTKIIYNFTSQMSAQKTNYLTCEEQNVFLRYMYKGQSLIFSLHVCTTLLFSSTEELKKKTSHIQSDSVAI